MARPDRAGGVRVQLFSGRLRVYLICWLQPEELRLLPSLVLSFWSALAAPYWLMSVERCWAQTRARVYTGT